MKSLKYFYVIVFVLLLPCIAQSHYRTIEVEWENQNTANIAGYRLYHKGKLSCETNVPTATTMDCSLDAPNGESWFTLTTLFQDGSESQHSERYSYFFTSNPKAAFTPETSSGNAPLPIVFNAGLSHGDIVSYEWEFGDGTTGSGKNVSHTFVYPGYYTVTLTITDSSGVIDSQAAFIVVTNHETINTPPTAVISSSTSVGETPLQIQFDSSGSTDNDGTIITYEWDMGDGGTATGLNPTYIYINPGIFYPTLTITDNGGLKDSISTPVIVTPPHGVTNEPPNGSISVSTRTPCSTVSLTFSAALSIDPDGKIINYAWDFGDGTNGSGISVSHTFNQPAKYTVTLIVTDNLGTTSIPVKETITIEDCETRSDTFPTLQPIYYLLLR